MGQYLYVHMSLFTGTNISSTSVAASTTPLHYGLADRTNYAHYSSPSTSVGSYYTNGPIASDLSPYHNTMLSYNPTGSQYIQGGATQGYAHHDSLEGLSGHDQYAPLLDPTSSAAYVPMGQQPQVYHGILPPRKFVFCRPLPRRMRQKVDAENAAAAAAAVAGSASSSQGKVGCVLL